MAVASPELGFQWDHDDSTPLPCASAPSSPARLSFSSQLPGFYSALSSPAQGLATLASSWNAEADQLDTSRRTKVINPDTIVFEFETSRRMTSQSQLDFQQQLQHELEDSPTMAYADQLFKNGKVLPSTPPAMPPPRLQVACNRSFSVPLPQAANFSELGLKQKQGRREDYRRTYFLNEEISGGLHRPQNDPNSPTSPQGFSRPERSAVAAPAVAHVVPVNRERDLDLMMEMTGPSLKTTKSFQESYKRRSIKNLLLFRSASHGRAQPMDKLREHTAAIWEVDRDATNYSNETQFKEKKKKKAKEKEKMAKEIKEKEKEKEKRIVKKTAVQRPGLLLCIGYNSKAMKKMN
ncbi:hypothetical protein ACLOJK_000265 [Asimina triloba]